MATNPSKIGYRGALKAAGLREDFRFHNLRHTFGSTVIRHADSREVMEGMGHADLTTTRRYLAFVDCEGAANRVPKHSGSGSLRRRCLSPDVGSRICAGETVSS